MDYDRQILESLWYRLQRHQFNCTQEQVGQAVQKLARQTGKDQEHTALFLYWMLREGGEDKLPTVFVEELKLLATKE